MDIVTPDVQLIALAPEIVLIIVAFLMLFFGPLVGGPKTKGGPKVGGVVSLLALTAAFLVNLYIGQDEIVTLGGMIVKDTFSLYFNALVIIAAVFSIIISFGYIDKFAIKEGEFYLLILFSTVGMMLMGSSTDLLSIFLALELMSIPIYVLVGFRKENLRAREASFKYFILGAVSSGIFVYGAALVYGSLGTTNLTEIAEALGSNITPLFLLGSAFIISGFLFKISAVPFHMWTPDVYEGANLPITAYMSVGVKAAAFSAFLRFAVVDLANSGDSWVLAIAFVAVATMALGNTAALAQNNLKRLLAYSSIAHVGYILVALIAGSEYGISSILFYLFIYIVVNLGIFSLLVYFSKDAKECETMDDLAGLGYAHPLMAVCMGIFLFSLAGIPPTGGFMGKLFLFIAAVKEGYVWLVVVAVIASGVSVYYYLKVMMALFAKGKGKAQKIKNPFAALVVVIAAIITIYLGVMPGHFMELARLCAAALF